MAETLRRHCGGATAFDARTILFVWFSLLVIIVCSAPTLGAWHFGHYLMSGFPR